MKRNLIVVYYERRSEEEPAEGYRNGYETRKFKTAEGKIAVEVPQLRNTDEPHSSQILKLLGQRTAELERLVTEMYVRGLSTRDVEDLLKTQDGELLLNRSSVSEVTSSLNEEYQKFINRDLSRYDLIYLFVDGVYESLRRISGRKEAILCAWGILATGEKIMLHLSLGNKENYESWKEFFREMLSRGLRVPMLVISDGAPGLTKAIDDCFPESMRQRCIAHKLRNISNKLNDQGQEELMPLIRNVYYSTSEKVAKLSATEIINEYSSTYPAAIKCFQEDLDCCVNFMKFPKGHYQFIRTTNLLERTFEEQKRRTKVIPRFFDEKSCIKLVFGTLIRVSNKWKRIKMNQLDLTLLKNMRSLFGWKDNSDDNFISKKYAA
ncbi:MAG: IS256 family transposase [Ignavibacteria bacterium]|nr:IS256 family transposase [Ignavibacteria bacterium]